jgi:hypothetical protein
MDQITLTKKENIKLFLLNYYLGPSPLYIIFRVLGGPLIFMFGLNFYFNANDRLGVGYGGFMLIFSVYYTLKPLWWVLSQWKSFKDSHFEIEATTELLIIREDASESRIEYSKFKKIMKYKSYFKLQLENDTSIYLPISQLSEKNINQLSANA